MFFIQFSELELAHPSKPLSGMYVLFVAFPLSMLKPCAEQSRLARDLFGKAIVLKKSQEDACAAAYEYWNKRCRDAGHIVSVPFAICTLSPSAEAWHTLESAAIVEHTWWLSRAGYRIYNDIQLSDSVFLEHIATEEF